MLTKLATVAALAVLATTASAFAEGTTPAAAPTQYPLAGRLSIEGQVGGNGPVGNIGVE